MKLFEKDNRTVKNPKHLQKKVFPALFTEKIFYWTSDSNEKIDTEVTASFPNNSRGYITSKFKTDEINELFHGKHCLWLEMLNKSFEDNIETKKGQPIGSFCHWTRKLEISVCTVYSKGKKKDKLNAEK